MNSDEIITLYALTTCNHCKSVATLLERNDFSYQRINVDELSATEKKSVVQEVRKLNRRGSFPTTVIGDKVVVGYKEDDLLEALGIR